jgi:single-strand DNA-binding protein
MSSSFHSITVVGNLGRDPEMRYTPSGQPVTTMSVATTRVFNNAAGEKQEETTWFRITVWGKQAETCNQYLKKGSKVAVMGRLTPDKAGNPRIWNKTDGSPAASFEVNASEVHFLSSNGNGQGAPAAEEENTDTIPF